MWDYLGIEVPDDTARRAPGHPLGGRRDRLLPDLRAREPDLGAALGAGSSPTCPTSTRQFERGEFGALREWLREHLHRHGRKFTPRETLERAIGTTQIDPEPYVRYLRGSSARSTASPAHAARSRDGSRPARFAGARLESPPMAKTRVGINGFGRIGRNFFRAALTRERGLRDRRRERPRRREDDGAPAASSTRRSGRSRATSPSRTASLHAGGAARSSCSPSATRRTCPGATSASTSCSSRPASSPTARARRSTSTPARRRSSSRRPRPTPTSRSRSASTTTSYDPEHAPHHLERLVHDQLPRADGEGAARRVRDRARLHDDDPRLHGRPAAPGHAALGPAPGARGGDQPDPDLDRRREGDRARAARARRASSTASPSARRSRPGSLTDLVATLGREATADEVNAAFEAAAASGAARSGYLAVLDRRRSSRPTSTSRRTRASSTAS